MNEEIQKKDEELKEQIKVEKDIMILNKDLKDLKEKTKNIQVLIYVNKKIYIEKLDFKIITTYNNVEWQHNNYKQIQIEDKNLRLKHSAIIAIELVLIFFILFDLILKLI